MNYPTLRGMLGRSALADSKSMGKFGTEMIDQINYFIDVSY